MSYAGVGWRLVATLIDWVVLVALFYVIALATGNTTGDGFQMEGGPALLGFVLAFVYYIALEATAGGTLGKLALGLRVVTADGAPIGWGPSLVRNLLRIVDGFFFYLVGAVLVWTSERKQRLGDRVAGTVVVRRGAQPQPAVPA